MDKPFLFYIWYIIEGKTGVYSNQIEEKQRELSPWSEKINAKQSAIDVSQSEYNFLKEKIDSTRKDLEQAEETIASLQETHRTKVLSKVIYFSNNYL